MNFSPSFKTALETTLTSLNGAVAALPDLENELVSIGTSVSPSEIRAASDRLKKISDLTRALQDNTADLALLISEI